jgi:MFS family permease
VTEPRDPRVRNLVAVGAGVFLGVILLVLLQAANGMIFPPPPGTDPNDPESMRRAMAAMTTPAYVGLILGYLIATTVACTIAARLAGTDPRRRARLVGLAFIVAGILNFRAIPHPTWVVTASLVAFVVAALLGPRLAGRPG